MTYYPVIIPTLNRYQHFKECIESLAACTHADKTELVIGLDCPPSEKYVEGWKLIKEYIPTIKGFYKITFFEHDKNLGAFKNGDFLRDYVLSNYDAYIYTEDDNVFSPCFLDYMNKSLELYKNDKSIIAISGYMNPIKWSKIRDANVIRIQDYMAWGIGVWKRTVLELNENMPEHYMEYICSNRKLLYKMRNNLRELYQLIFWIKSKPLLNTRCDFTIACYCIINNKSVINPTFSLVKNMGYDGSGVNCGALDDDCFARQPISSETVFDLQDSLNESEFKLCREVWETYKSKNFSESQRKQVLQYYNMYMLFGYRIGDFLLSITPVLVSSIKSIIKLFLPYGVILLHKHLRENRK